MKLLFIYGLLLKIAFEEALARAAGWYSTGGMKFEFQDGLEAWTPRNECAETPAEAKSAPAEDGPMRRHPRWVRLEQCILKALLPFVEARDAVAAALQAVEPEPQAAG
jgi:hypothetical protein